MKLVVSINDSYNTNYNLYLDKDAFVINKGDIRFEIESSKEERINTLISLFSLKSVWEKKESNKNYAVSFYENDSVEEFSFDDSFPSNWMLFLGSLEKLAGDKLWKTIKD